jgi:hypothetical protein
MKEAIVNIRENTGSVSGNLRNLQVGENNKTFIELADAARIRCLITQIHNTNDSGINAGITFKTAAAYDESEKQIGIYVWRLS